MNFFNLWALRVLEATLELHDSNRINLLRAEKNKPFVPKWPVWGPLFGPPNTPRKCLCGSPLLKKFMCFSFPSLWEPFKFGKSRTCLPGPLAQDPEKVSKKSGDNPKPLSRHFPRDSPERPCKGRAGSHRTLMARFLIQNRQLSATNL